MPHVSGHSPHGGTVNNEKDTGYAGYKSSGSGSQSANVNNNSDNQTFQSYINNNKNDVNINNSNDNGGSDKNDGFISQNNKNVTDGNELSELDKIAEQNAQNNVYQDNLKEAIEIQENNKKKWGLDSYADKNLNGGKIDTSPGVVDEITELHDAAKKMAVILGLDPNKKKDLQKALNFLSGDEWGSQASLRTTANRDAINTLKNSLGKNKDGKQIEWKTWGTGLRGDSRWKGVGPLNKGSYSSALNAMSANVEAGTPAFDYHRALVNSHKPLKSDAGLLETLFMQFIPGSSLLKDSGIVNWLNEHNDVDKIGVDENGIFNFEYNGQKINVNNGSPFTDTKWEDYLLTDGDNEVGGNYQTYSYDNTGVVDDEEETEEEEETKKDDDDMVAWYDFNLFEKLFSPLNKG